MDTLPPALNPDSTSTWITHVTGWMSLLATPAGMGLIVNLTWVQALEAFDHLPWLSWACKPGTRDIKKAAAVILAIALSVPTCAVFGWLAGWGVRGDTFVFGFMGGIGGVVVSALLDRAGLNLDHIFGQDNNVPSGGDHA